MPHIHPTAVVDPGAEIANTAEIGPYCVVGANVVVGEDCRLTAHVNVAGHTTIGARTVVSPFASLGTPPQSVKYRGGPTRLLIGEDCDIRESVTINTGTEDGGGITEIGVLGGHVTIGDHAFLGGLAAIHQFVRIGESVMISGVSGVAADVIPFAFAIGQRAVLDGLNLVGLRRRGVPRLDIHRLRRAYRALFMDGGPFRDRVAAVEREFAGDPLVGKVMAFIRERKSRPLMLPFSATAPADSSTDDAS
jgi:UDP-N-acetylglucosamine acyltransferase